MFYYYHHQWCFPYVQDQMIAGTCRFSIIYILYTFKTVFSEQGRCMSIVDPAGTRSADKGCFIWTKAPEQVGKASMTSPSNI